MSRSRRTEAAIPSSPTAGRVGVSPLGHQRSEGLSGIQSSFFAGMPIGIDGLATLVSGTPPEWLKPGLSDIAAQVAAAKKQYVAEHPEVIASILKAGYQAAMALRHRVSHSQFEAGERADLVAELDL